MDEDEPIDLPFEPISNVVCVECGWPTAVAIADPVDWSRSCTCPMCLHRWEIPAPATN